MLEGRFQHLVGQVYGLMIESAFYLEVTLHLQKSLIGTDLLQVQSPKQPKVEEEFYFTQIKLFWKVYCFAVLWNVFASIIHDFSFFYGVPKKIFIFNARTV